MTKQFETKVIRNGAVDTKAYRYIASIAHDAASQWCEIKRIPLAILDTVAAYDGWETVKVIY